MANRKSKVVISIQDGIVSVLKCPRNVQVCLKDYDIEGADVEGVKRDKDGNYVERELRGIADRPRRYQ